MNNKFSALAFAAFLACGAQAVHAQSNVTIYGLIDLSAGISKSGSGTTLPGGTVPTAGSQTVRRMDSGLTAGSRLGFRGAEDLGNGLKANFTLEMGIAADTGGLNQGGLAWGRQVFVGLSGAQWSVTAGRQYTPIDVALATSEPLAGGHWGNITNLSAGFYDNVGTAAGDGAYQLLARADNSLLATFTSSGLTAKLMVSAGNENTRGTGRLVNPNLDYTNGPFSAVASYARFRQPSGMITAAAQPEWLTAWMLGANYDFGFLRAYVGAFEYEGPKNRANLSAAATLGGAGASPFAFAWNEMRVVWVGAKVPLGTGNLLAQVGRITMPYDGAPDGRATVAGIAYHHPLSKRTTLYTNYGMVSNNARSNLPVVGAIPLVGPAGFGSDPRALSFGMRHSF